MKKYAVQKSDERAVERWENEGGEILAIALLDIKKKEVEKQQRRHGGEMRVKRRLLRNAIG